MSLDRSRKSNRDTSISSSLLQLRNLEPYWICCPIKVEISIQNYFKTCMRSWESRNPEPPLCIRSQMEWKSWGTDQHLHYIWPRIDTPMRRNLYVTYTKETVRWRTLSIFRKMWKIIVTSEFMMVIHSDAKFTDQNYSTWKELYEVKERTPRFTNRAVIPWLIII